MENRYLQKQFETEQYRHQANLVYRSTIIVFPGKRPDTPCAVECWIDWLFPHPQCCAQFSGVANSASIGALHIPPHIPPQSDFDQKLALDKADKFLYQAKAKGRNRVVFETLQRETLS
ncbi:MAG: hypothetical protein PHQ83_00555 [Eubacteriales bacterium]|nr:hypothetical protein [Eubacteriales bacterium]